jgi:hypothetical protein
MPLVGMYSTSRWFGSCSNGGSGVNRIQASLFSRNVLHVVSVLMLSESCVFGCVRH